jgi:hypothetical protein
VLADLQNRGSVLGLSEDRVGGGYERGRLAGASSGEAEVRGHWKIRAHRPRSWSGTTPAADRIAEVPDGGGRFQNTPGRSFVRSLDSPAK